jgi:transposase-like protein
MDTVHSAITEPVRRLEVFTGAGRRRKWSDEDKARIVAEIVASGDSVCSVARRHGLSPQQLFGWRRQLRGAAGGPFRIGRSTVCAGGGGRRGAGAALGRIAATPSRPLAPVTRTLFGTICFWAVTFIRLTSFPGSFRLPFMLPTQTTFLQPGGEHRNHFAASEPPRV